MSLIILFQYKISHAYPPSKKYRILHNKNKYHVPMIIHFHSTKAALENSGGKGLNLVRLSRAGLNVPGGFIISTSAYRKFLKQNSLAPLIRKTLSACSGSPRDFEKASRQIRTSFSAAKMPVEIQEKILEAYEKLTKTPYKKTRMAVAVRSSATTEDLPELSFAGQQDTFLNVTTPRQFLRAVTGCWSSLYSARAISYRAQKSVPGEPALAVVVQLMVEAEVSGVIFTANPLSGRRNEILINATFGLGEALVSGQVDPDQFIVDTQTRECISKHAGAKEKQTLPKAGGGTHEKIINSKTDSTKRRTGKAPKTPRKLSLGGAMLQKLTETGLQIETEYGSPQDIEWAIAGEQIYILQSRPVTSLFPVPVVSYDPLHLWISFGAVQGYLGPMSPLGRDAIFQLFFGLASHFDDKLKEHNFKILKTSAQRLWVKVSGLLHYRIPWHIFTRFMGVAEPRVQEILFSLKDDPRLMMGRAKIKWRVVPKVLKIALPVGHHIMKNMIFPNRVRQNFEVLITTRLSAIQIDENPDPYERLNSTVKILKQQLREIFPLLLPRFIPILGPSMACLYLINHFVKNMNLTMKLTRGLPHNVTTEMDLALWQVAQKIQSDARSAKRLKGGKAETIARDYLQGSLPEVAQKEIENFLKQYGMRGIGEIDFGQKRWRENPVETIHTIQSYFELSPEQAPDVLFAKSALQAQEAVEEICSLVRARGAGRLKEKIVRAAARRIRLFMGARESPKFLIIRIMGVARSALLEVGDALRKTGALEAPDDLVFLSFTELENLAKERDTEKFKSLIVGRKSAHETEKRRKQIPKVVASDGRVFYEGIVSNQSKNTITGSPVSPGIAEGVVRVISDPRKSRLVPGEILVCHGTDPAWTPLFMSAGGLITEVGGMMTHGSVVAREYGIPAVVGVHEATTRLKSGQKIKIDGSSGKIVILK